MGLKIKQLTDFMNEFGMTDSSTVASIINVNFNYKEMDISITYEFTPSTYIEGMPKRQMTQVLPLDFEDEQVLGIILTVSDKLHAINDDVAFIPTMDGVKSFTDFNAETIDVGF